MLQSTLPTLGSPSESRIRVSLGRVRSERRGPVLALGPPVRVELSSKQSTDHSYFLVSAESLVTVQFSWELPVGRREDLRGSRGQECGTKDQGKPLRRLGLRHSLKGGKAFGDRKGVDI